MIIDAVCSVVVAKGVLQLFYLIYGISDSVYLHSVRQNISYFFMGERDVSTAQSEGKSKVASWGGLELHV